jgi:hypothetical protein
MREMRINNGGMGRRGEQGTYGGDSLRMEILRLTTPLPFLRSKSESRETRNERKGSN